MDERLHPGPSDGETIHDPVFKTLLVRGWRFFVTNTPGKRASVIEKLKDHKGQLQIMDAIMAQEIDPSLLSELVLRELAKNAELPTDIQYQFDD